MDHKMTAAFLRRWSKKMPTLVSNCRAVGSIRYPVGTLLAAGNLHGSGFLVADLICQRLRWDQTLYRQDGQGFSRPAIPAHRQCPSRALQSTQLLVRPSLALLRRYGLFQPTQGTSARISDCCSVNLPSSWERRDRYPHGHPTRSLRLQNRGLRLCPKPSDRISASVKPKRYKDRW